MIIYIKQDSFIKSFENIENDNIYLENGFKKIVLDDKYKDCKKVDFNDDFTFDIDRYNERKQQIANEEYENKIVSLIRQKYNINQELAILRQRDTKPEEFAEYNEYVEECKAKVKSELGN